jgi:CheY-like chemotaxis protein
MARVCKTIQIALVENETDYREMLASWLSDRFTVHCFAGGQELIEALKQDADFDLVISDINMPGMSGLDLIAELRADPSRSSLPALAITAHLSEKDRQSVLAAGFNEFVNKLAGFDELDARITRMLDVPG